MTPLGRLCTIPRAIAAEPMLLRYLQNQEQVIGEDCAMSAVTALSLVLIVGFVATGLVGFFGWRQRMREGSAR